MKYKVKKINIEKLKVFLKKARAIEAEKTKNGNSL